MRKLPGTGYASYVVLSCFISLQSCQSIPNPEADGFIRSMRELDRAQRPEGQDLPMERFVAWQTQRDTGSLSPPELQQALELLASETAQIVQRIDAIKPRTTLARDVIAGYRISHESARLGFEDLIDDMRLNTAGSTVRGENRVRTAIAAIRQVRQRRRAVEVQFGGEPSH